MDARDAASLTWDAYYRNTTDRGPRETTLFALDRFEKEPVGASKLFRPLALDLGCGSGRDTIEILNRGWRVLAIDGEPAALEQLRSRRELPSEPWLETRLARIEDTTLPGALFINSSFALPLCPPELFFPLWSRTVAALMAGGRFAGQFFGERDSWADPETGKTGITFLARRQAEDLLSCLKVEYFAEEDGDSTTPRGKTKHWHIFHVVAQKL
ncbi:MAG: class I SAM-dependent methyltransferase [Alphaproteobacteria bacterium]|nr:class I SAM-dependent methyltransferase [Alphaproteobacteria bacterium]